MSGEWMTNCMSGESFTYLSYTKYDILCHMLFNVTMVTFWMTLLMNK